MQRTLEIQELLSESGWLRALAASLVGDPAQADDLVQDTWLAALRRPPHAEADARPWLARVAHNLARNARRGSARREVREELARTERDEPTPEALAQVAEAQRMLAEAVTRLPEGLRAVIVLCYFQGLDSRTAGTRLGLSASAVRTRLQAALVALRADLDRRPGGREAWAGVLAGLARTSAGGTASTASDAKAGASTVASLAPGSLALAATAMAVVLAVVFVARTKGSEVGEAATEERIAFVDSGPSDPQRAEARASASEPALEAGGREALPLDANERAQASPPAPAATARISGTIRVDGRPPEWPLELSLEPTSPPPDSNGRRRRVTRIGLALEPERGGAFAFEGLPPSWDGTLRIEHHVLANGEPTLALAAPRTDLVLDVRAGPAIVGRLLDPQGRPCGGLQGRHELAVGLEDEEARAITTAGFACLDDGRFRIPCVERGDWGEIKLRVEAEGVGFLHHESPRFAPAAGHDLGELQLEPLRPLAFRMNDPAGRPIAGASACVEGFPWAIASAPTDVEGKSSLPFTPDRPTAVRFGAPRYADRVVTVDGVAELEIELEPLAVIELRLAGAGSSRASLVVLSSEQTAFVWDASDWNERPNEPEERTARQASTPTSSGGAQRARAVQGSVVPSVRRWPAPGQAGQRYEYEFTPSAEGRLSLLGLVPSVALTLEVRDAEQRVLAVATTSVTAREWAELEILVP